MNNVLESNKELVDLLNNLARYCVNGRFLYAQAALKAKSQDLFAIFDQYAGERNSFINEFQQSIEALDGQIYLKADPRLLREDFITLSDFSGEGTAENVEFAEVASDDVSDFFWLTRCIDYEWSALAAYEYAVQAHLPISLYSMLQDHHERITQSVNTLELLYKTHKYWSA